MTTKTIPDFNGETTYTPTANDLIAGWSASGGKNVPILWSVIARILCGGTFLTPSGDTSGVTDFAVIQSALTIAGLSTNAQARYVAIQAGVYYVNAKLVFTSNTSSANGFSGSDMFQIVGLGQVQINQVTSNTGILEIQVPEGGEGELTNIYIAGIWFRYPTQQTSANTAAVCLGFRDVTNPVVNSVIAFNVYIERCKFQNAYRAIGNTQPSGQFALSDIRVANCYAFSLSGAFFVNGSAPSIGCPNITFDMILVQASYLGGSEPIFNIAACNNFCWKNVEILNTINVVHLNINNSNFSIISCKNEACRWDYGASFQFTTGPIVANSSSGSIVGYNCVGLTISVASGASPAILTCSTQSSPGVRSVTMSDIAVNLGTGAAGAFLTMVNTVAGTQVVFTSQPSVTNVANGACRLTDSAHTATLTRTSMLYPPGGAISADQGDASATFVGWDPTGGTSTPTTFIWNTPLTANRTLTLPTASASADNYWDGLTVTVIRTANATGASTLIVNGSIPSSKTVAIGSMTAFTYQQSLGWVETDAGTL